ncbi:hypothetical protein UFOVP1227_1, partial [uncultured Caudovirales phage]
RRQWQAAAQMLAQCRREAAALHDDDDPRVTLVAQAIEPRISDMIFDRGASYQQFLSDIGDVARAAVAAFDGTAP